MCYSVTRCYSTCVTVLHVVTQHVLVLHVVTQHVLVLHVVTQHVLQCYTLLLNMCYSVTRCYSTVWLWLHVHEDVLQCYMLLYLLECIYRRTSLIPRPHLVYIASSITCAILKAVHAGVGFGSGTKATGLDVFKYHPFPKPAFVDNCPSDIKEMSPLYELSVC